MESWILNVKRVSDHLNQHILLFLLFFFLYVQDTGDKNVYPNKSRSLLSITKIKTTSVKEACGMVVAVVFQNIFRGFLMHVIIWTRAIWGVQNFSKIEQKDCIKPPDDTAHLQSVGVFSRSRERFVNSQRGLVFIWADVSRHMYGNTVQRECKLR